MGNTIYVQCVLSLGGNKALVPATTSKGDAFYELDLISGELSKTDGKEYEWLNIEDLFSSFTGSDGQIYCVEDDGIYRIDAEKKKNEEVFRYSWCSLNKGLWSDFELIEYTEDSIIYLGQTEETPLYSGEKNTFKIKNHVKRLPISKKQYRQLLKTLYNIIYAENCFVKGILTALYIKFAVKYPLHTVTVCIVTEYALCLIIHCMLFFVKVHKIIPKHLQIKLTYI